MTNQATTTEILAALDAWCDAQPNVLRFDTYVYQAQVFTTTDTNGHYRGERHEWLNVYRRNPMGGWRWWQQTTPATLTALAIQHRYGPWLRLAANMPYLGQVAAKLALFMQGHRDSKYTYAPGTNLVINPKTADGGPMLRAD